MDYIVNKNGHQILIESNSTIDKSFLLQRFKEMRKEQKITQEELAEAAGMNRTDVSRFESGKYNPSLELMLRYANALGCKLQIQLVKINSDENDIAQLESEHINSLVNAMNHIAISAVAAYKPIVDDLCSRVATADEVEHTLDWMLDFCGYDTFLPLCKQLCRHYINIYPEIISYEIQSYKEYYDQCND